MNGRSSFTVHAVMAEWFEEWFDETYLHLYPHRDDADAEEVVALIRRTLPWQPTWRVLDVACGAGRHARALEAAGARCVGLDLSVTLLRRARGVTRAPLIRADMRALPIRPGSADLAVNLFTSFGYFDRDEEHAAALGEMTGTVRAGGWFVLDFLNAGTVRHTLKPGAQPVGGTGATANRRISSDGRFVFKTIALADGRRVEERVRLFTPAELEGLLAHAGVDVAHRFGDYAGGPLAGGAPRTVLMGRVG